MGQMVRAIIQRLGYKLRLSLTSYAVVGAAAYMGGATRMTLTTTVMVMETTGSLQLIVPIIMTVFVAKVSCCAARYLQMQMSCACSSNVLQHRTMLHMPIPDQAALKLLLLPDTGAATGMLDASVWVEAQAQVCRWWGTTLAWAWMIPLSSCEGLLCWTSPRCQLTPR